jgi:hypothetical protein
MLTYTPFLCSVTPYGTPFFVSQEPALGSFVINNLTAEEICRYYWLLESVMIHYKFTFNGSMEIQDSFVLGGANTEPQWRILSVPSYYSSILNGSFGIRAESSIDFSTVYLQENGLYAINFNFAIYNDIETVAGSSLLISFYRSVGNSGQRNAYKSLSANFLGKNLTAYLNYDNRVWDSSEIEFNEISLETTFYNNDAL